MSAKSGNCTQVPDIKIKGHAERARKIMRPLEQHEKGRIAVGRMAKRERDAESKGAVAAEAGGGDGAEVTSPTTSDDSSDQDFYSCSE